MAVSAYASLVSLTHVLDNVHYRAHYRLLQVDIVLIETLQDKVHSLLDFVEAHSQCVGEHIRGLWRQISEFAFDADQTFDSHVVDQLLHQSARNNLDLKLKGCMPWFRSLRKERNSTFHGNLDRLIQKADFLNKELVSIVDVVIDKQPIVSVPYDRVSGGKSALVGFDEHVFSIMDKLTSYEKKRQIIPIVGMGGIGKTTLARNVYHNSCIVDHFDTRMWLTISQDHSIRQLLGDLLGYEAWGNDECQIPPLVELGEKLHKTLFGRRDLIVMDDAWTTTTCEELMIYFPDNGNGSRIMVTTRLLEVATFLGYQNPYFINFLNEDQSWNLLCQTIFAQDSCPHPELEDIGKDIAKNCRGLPLAITVIGSQLAKSNMTWAYWTIVSKDLYALGNLGDNDHCLKVLSLSYNTLPISLKPCFLYLRIFPEDAMIDASRLIKFWIDEGFIKQKGDKSMEDVAKEYVNDLINRNLLFIRQRLNCGKVLLCGIHDLLRELCIRESSNENFLLMPKIQYSHKIRSRYSCYAKVNVVDGVSCHYFRCIAPMVKKKVVNVPKSKFGLLNVCDACRTMYSHPQSLRLARVIDCPQEFLQPTRLRHVELSAMLTRIPYSHVLGVLWNLHTLVLQSFYSESNTLPVEIWDMTQLRHVEVFGVALPQPVVQYVEGIDIMIMKNLRVLSTSCWSITKKVLERIQNLKTLELECPLNHIQWRKEECHDYSLTNLNQLSKLEVLMVRSYCMENISFSDSLKKLSLEHLENPSKVIPIIGSLPNLEELELYEPQSLNDWSPVEGQFLQLKGFILESKCLEYWEADQSHFPRLEWLRLTSCYNLKEIPLAIGDIATLRSIELHMCSESAFESAKQLWEEQQNYGNESLQLHVYDNNYEEHQFGVLQPIYLSFTWPAYLE